MGFNCRADYWTRKADFPGTPRRGAFGFSVANKGFVGGGTDSLYNNQNDLWEYDVINDAWNSKASVPVMPYSNISITIGKKGYLYADDGMNFWEYDPSLNIWNPKANYPGQFPVGVQAFVINNQALLSGGVLTTVYTPYFYIYNQSSDAWSVTSNSPFQIMLASSFVVNNKAYLICAANASQSAPPLAQTVLEYDLSNNSWSQKADFPDTARADAAALTIGNIGYFGTGDNGGGAHFKDWWQYNPILDTWTKKSPLPSNGPIDESAFFTINNKGYICFGGENFNNNLWEYTPDSISTSNTPTLASEQNTTISPNPFTTQLIIQSSAPNTRFNISDMSGKLVCYGTTVGKQEVINTTTWKQGTYIVELVGEDGSKEVRKVVK